MTNTRQRVAKSLNFRGGSQEERETSPLPNIVPLVALAATSSRVGPLAMVPDFLPVAANINVACKELGKATFAKYRFVYTI